MKTHVLSLSQHALCLKDPLMVHVSPNRNNLRFAIIKTKKDAMFAELDRLVHHIKEKGDLTDKTIILLCFAVL